MAAMAATFPPPPTSFYDEGLPRLYTGPYCVSITDRDYCVYSLISCLVERKGGKRFPKVTDEWKDFAENLIAFYGVSFWTTELAPYLKPAKPVAAVAAPTSVWTRNPDAAPVNLPTPDASPFAEPRQEA